MEVDYRIANCLEYGLPDNKNIEVNIRCGVCDRAIYEGEDYYDFFGEKVCAECEFDYVLKTFHKYL